MENIKLNIAVYNIIYSICNIFSTYTVAKFMHVFFDKETSNKKIEFCSYVGYFIITTSLYLLIRIPLVMMLCNLILMFLVTYNYKADIKVRIFSTVFIYLLLMLIEELIVLIPGNTYESIFAESSYFSIWGLICMKLISFAIVDIFEKNKNKKNGMVIPLAYWLCICVIPFISLYLVFILFKTIALNNIELVICITILLFENFVVFYLYDVISIKLENKAVSLLLEQQNKFYFRQLNLMQVSLQSMKDFRHDLKNHLSTIQSLAKENNSTTLVEYINKMSDVIYSPNNISNSNNVIIDSIINFKYKEAIQSNINFKLDITIPNDLKIDPFDITVILGNLIDNAIQGVKKIKDYKEILINLKYDKGRLLIKVVNNYEGNIVINNNLPETTNKDKENHGIGLKNIKKALEKYKGEMDIQTKDNKFYVSIILYIG